MKSINIYVLCIYVHIYMRPTWNMSLYTPENDQYANEIKPTINRIPVRVL